METECLKGKPRVGKDIETKVAGRRVEGQTYVGGNHKLIVTFLRTIHCHYDRCGFVVNSSVDVKEGILFFA